MSMTNNSESAPSIRLTLILKGFNEVGLESQAALLAEMVDGVCRTKNLDRNSWDFSFRLARALLEVED